MSFKKFADQVEHKFNAMAKDTLFQTDQSDLIWDAYLGAFPEGSNPIFKERTEHDCQCCRQFVRRIGSVVCIKDGKLDTVWDIPNAPAPYDVVAKALHELVSNAQITSVFVTAETKYGNRATRSMGDNGDVLTWEHFEGSVPSKYVSRQVGEIQGRATNNYGLLKRGLTELSTDALEEIVGLVTTDPQAIYRAEEHLSSMQGFLTLKKKYDGLGAHAQELFLWENINHPSALFKNTVIGTLIADLSGGKTLDQAVGSFEAKVAPHNYKRPKALITKGMIDKAMSKIDELGLRESLERRHANIRDVSVNDILFVDRSVESQMKDSLRDTLMEEVAVRSSASNPKKAVDISVGDFLTNVLPKAKSLDILVENRLQPNLVSITAPVSQGVPRLFTWGNDFSWSYLGGAADSNIKQRVSKAGGNVTAPLRISLAWFNRDDLDIHVIEPSGMEIFFRNKRSNSGGFLDVDMNVSSPVRDAVENVCWTTPPDGKYQVHVHNFARREGSDVGFELELENNGNISSFSYSHPLADRAQVLALQMKVVKGEVVEVSTGTGVTGGLRSQKIWGVDTGQYVRVQTVMNSPNHWHGEAKGNKHLFFILEGCYNPDPVRGMYNENLRPELHENRKVFEVLASKMMCSPSDEQLSGLGFSSTQKNNVTMKVRGDVDAIYNVQF